MPTCTHTRSKNSYYSGQNRNALPVAVTQELAGPVDSVCRSTRDRWAGAAYSCVTRVTQEYEGPVGGVRAHRTLVLLHTESTGPPYSCVTRVTHEYGAPADRLPFPMALVFHGPWPAIRLTP